MLSLKCVRRSKPVVRGTGHACAAACCASAGYYDDDEGTAAIVYIGGPFESDYVLIRRTDLEKVSAKSIDLERWKRKYPRLAKELGLR